MLDFGRLVCWHPNTIITSYYVPQTKWGNILVLLCFLLLLGLSTFLLESPFDIVLFIIRAFHLSVGKPS